MIFQNMILLNRSVKSCVHSTSFDQTQNYSFLFVLFNFFNFCNLVNWNSSLVPIIEQFATFAFESDIFICNINLVLHRRSTMQNIELFYKLKNIFNGRINFFSFLIILKQFDDLKIMNVFHSVFVCVVCKLSR